MQSLTKSIVLFVFLAISSYGQCVLGLNPKSKKLECVAVGGAGGVGDVVGPAGATAGALAFYSGVSGKVIAGNSAICIDNANTRLGVGTCSPTVQIHAYNAGASFQINAGATTYARSGASNLQIGTINTGYALIFVTESAERGRIMPTTGNFLFGGTTFTDGNYKFDVQASGSTGTMRVFDQVGAGSTLAVIQAGAAQSGNLLSVRNNAGTELAYFNSGGALTTPFIVAGPSQLANAVVDINYTNANVFGMGGPLALRWSSGSTGTSGFDSGLKRSAAGYVAVTDGSTGLGKIVVSQATPSASTDAGTAGAIWADATYIYVQTGASTVKRIALTTF